METALAFGRAGIKVELPGGFQYRLLEARSAKALPNWQQILEAALDAPIGAPPLSTLASGKNSAAISVCDVPGPRLTLRSCLRCCGACWKRAFRARMSPFSSRPVCIARRRRTKYGKYAARKWPPLSVREPHGAGTAVPPLPGNGPGGHAGVYRRSICLGGPSYSLGFIEPYLMLGYSGGRKLVAPVLRPRKPSRYCTVRSSCAIRGRWKGP